MSRRDRTHVTENGVSTPIKTITLDEFGKRLYQRMTEKGWRQSDLAKRAGVPRDSVSSYVRGLTKPTGLSLSKLAKALNCSEEELFPNHTMSAVANDLPAFEMRVSPNDPGRATIKMNMHMSTAIANKISALLFDNVAVNE